MNNYSKQTKYLQLRAKQSRKCILVLMLLILSTLVSFESDEINDEIVVDEDEDDDDCREEEWINFRFLISILFD